MDHAPCDPLRNAVIDGDDTLARQLAEEASRAGLDARQLVERAMIPAMDEVGARFERNEYFVPELLLSARAMKAAFAVLAPALAAGPAASRGRIAIGTVRGDLHDIGKNLVTTMLQGAGFDILDLGVDVAPDRFVEAVCSDHVDVIAMSSLITTTMPGMAGAIGALDRAGLRSAVKVIVGGAPVTAAYAARIGADGYSDNAAGAVALVRRLLEGGPSDPPPPR
jgi:5-methyltetrahydrofolate--homocysteine methyltransferase